MSEKKGKRQSRLGGEYPRRMERKISTKRESQRDGGRRRRTRVFAGGDDSDEVSERALLEPSLSEELEVSLRQGTSRGDGDLGLPYGLSRK